jgi:GT2 family glycosyltransferase
MNRLIKRVIELEDTEQVLIMNPDIEFRAGWDEHLSENNGIMGFILVKPDGTIEHAGAYGGGEHKGRGDQDSPDKFTKVEEVDWVTFGAVAIHKKVVDQVGLMEANDYPHFGSDREYCRKSRESGFSVTCSPSRLTHYYGWATRPYIFREVPRAIWERNAKERADSGVYFPSAGAFTLTEEELERRIKGA